MYPEAGSQTFLDSDKFVFIHHVSCFEVFTSFWDELVQSVLWSKYMKLLIPAAICLYLLFPVACKDNSKTEEKDSPPRLTSKKSFEKVRTKKGHKKRRRKSSSPSTMSDTIRMKARIVHVVDADTVHFLSESGKRHKSRLDGINAPECHKKRIRTLDGKMSSACISDDEPGGYNAYLFLKNLIEGKNVKIECSGNNNTGKCVEDTYGRVLSTIYLNNVNINDKIVAEGHALSFTKYPSKMRWKYCISESEAREKGNGFWGKSGKDVINSFSTKTRQWYKKHHLLCHQAIKEKNRL